MNYQLLDECSKVIENKQILVNAISRRVRQLSSGVRPHIEPEPRMTFTDIAMSEILAGKLKLEFPTPAES